MLRDPSDIRHPQDLEAAQALPQTMPKQGRYNKTFTVPVHSALALPSLGPGRPGSLRALPASRPDAAAAVPGTPVADTATRTVESTMSISLLRKVAASRLPLNVSDTDQVDELIVLMQAGLIAALRVRDESDRSTQGRRIVRILAVTQDGRRLLCRAEAVGAADCIEEHATAGAERR